MMNCAASGLLFLAAVLATAAPQNAAETSRRRAPPAPAAVESGADAEIRRAADEFVAAFNRGDAKAVAAHWTADGEYVDEAGRVFAGREAIEKEYAAFFQEHPGVDDARDDRFAAAAGRRTSPSKKAGRRSILSRRAPRRPRATWRFT